MPILTLVVLVAIAQTASASTKLIAVGDVGCKSAAVQNLKTIAKNGTAVLGLGDYSYKCSNATLKPLWDAVNDKVGVQGNHECEKSGQDGLKAATVFGNGGCKGNSNAWKLGDVGIIGINQYANFKVGSTQYKNIINASEKFSHDPTIKHIAYAFHEPGHGLKCSGSHCHKDDKTFATIYDPIIKKYHGITLDAHTHLTGFGNPKGFATAQCGGGGEDSTKMKKTTGFEYGSSKMGYCLLDFQEDQIVAQHISSIGQVLHTHTYLP